MQKSVEILQGGYYHIYNRSNNKELLFKEERNYLYFMQLYEKYIYPLADLLAYCLLPNHFHFFIKTKTFSSEEKSNRFSRSISNMFNAYAKGLNKSYRRDGSLFKERFRRKAIANDFH
jgi:REP element-mobilizing transposase RayT